MGSRCFLTSAHNARPAMPGVSGNFGIQRVNIRWDHYCEGSGIQGVKSLKYGCVMRESLGIKLFIVPISAKCCAAHFDAIPCRKQNP